MFVGACIGVIYKLVLVLLCNANFTRYLRVCWYIGGTGNQVSAREYSIWMEALAFILRRYTSQSFRCLDHLFVIL
jgi:hypothetical protein